MSDEANTASNAVSESVVDSAQVATDAPVVDAAASDATASDKPASSAREAVERAFAKIQAEPEPKQDASAEKQPHAKSKDRYSDGTFKPKDGETPSGKQVASAQADAAKDAAKQQQQVADQVKPPPSRFAKPAQDAWAQTPEPVRAEVERAIGELQQGIEKYKGAAEAFAPVQKYHEMATQGGTTLEKALDAYVGIETAWRNNPAQGFVQVCHNMGVHPNEMLQAIAHSLQGGQVQAPRGDSPEVSQLKQRLAQFEQKFGTLEKTFADSQKQISQRAAEGTISAFAKDNPHFDEVADTIAQMLETGFAKDLPDAYAKAVRLNPDVAAKIEAAKTPKPDTAAQTREKAAKSITGSPATGSHPATRQVPDSPRKALEGAFAQLGL